MQYAHNENWLLTGEDDGKLKYWKPNLECVKVAFRLLLDSQSVLHAASCGPEFLDPHTFTVVPMP